jgi:AsmA family protein
VHGDGRYQGAPFDLHVSAGSPLRLLDERRDYPIEASVQVADTDVRLEGNVTQPLKLKGLSLNLSLKGPNPARLQKLVGQALPRLPPYEIEGELSREGGIWRFEDFQVMTGDSDLAGDIAVYTLREPRLLVVADLVSGKLDLDDLAGLTGAPPDPDETVSPRQKKKAKAQASDPEVLPDNPVDLSALRAIDARVTYQGKRVERTLPIDDVGIQAKLMDGRLVLKPLNFGVGGGDITSRLMLDASERSVRAKLATDIDQVDLKEIVRRFTVADASVGDIGGRARLRATGASVAELMATLDGRLSLVMAGGRIDTLLIELAGLDITESLAALLSSDDAYPIRCAFTDFQTRDGQVDVQTFLADTTDTRFSGDGNLNLDEERLHLVIAPHPKDWSLFSFPTPLHIKGRFSDLAFYPEYSELLELTANAVVLGLVGTPFAGLIPLVEMGTGENSACRSLLDESKDQRRLQKEQRSTASSPGDEREGSSPTSFMEEGR